MSDDVESPRRARGPQGVMKSWQAMLEAFCCSTEPMTWDVESVRIDPVDKFEAVAYLVEKGLLEQCGRVREEHNDALYRPTEPGLFMWSTGLTELNRRKRPNGVREAVLEPTLAQRTAAIAHTSVFELAAKPWTYSLRAEELKEFGEEVMSR